MTQGNMQLGKQGVTDNFILTLKNHFKKHKDIRVKVLKNAGHEKQKIKQFSEEILNRLGKNYTSRVVGFSIFIKRWRKEKR